MRCSACQNEALDGSRFCPSCGSSFQEPGSELTATNLGATPTSMPSGSGGGEVRFLPGAVIARRYRIVGLLGRGGMGEVYRADDLKLGQPVALKFLPAAVERDASRLDRFLNEVRTALKVSHPNVCRVYDIGEFEAPSVSTSAPEKGQTLHYLSMEYVDGEDLSSLLTRIGFCC